MTAGQRPCYRRAAAALPLGSGRQQIWDKEWKSEGLLICILLKDNKLALSVVLLFSLGCAAVLGGRTRTAFGGGGKLDFRLKFKGGKF